MIPSFIYADRYRNEGTRSYSRHAAYTEAAKAYRPDADHAGFALPVFALPRAQLKVYAANPAPALLAYYLNDHQGLFCLHPQVLAEKRADPYVQHTLARGAPRPGMAVVPSSSSRTLYVQGAAIPHALKVHFPFRVSRYERKMRDEVIEQAINVSLELERGTGRLDHHFAFLREVLGVVHQRLANDRARGENWGYLVREMTPFPPAPDRRGLLPGFALYGRDFYDPGARPLLFELIGEQEPCRFVLDHILLPVVRHWVSCFRQFGFLLEPHGQNLLLELNARHRITRLVHRDLSVGIDMRRRRDLGLCSDHLNHYNRMESGAFHSITYDKFMGSHFFDRIVAECLAEYAGLAREDFCGPCREAFAHAFPEHERYLPRTQWYFSERRDRYHKPLYRNTGRPPEWRP
ncbi:IucA/IucC family protein [Oceanimonas pelagia]|uniref:IucA/IucC family protein n=1 Tax=Oceanimonas pelagia TaxID=3028314 RepID=A0AA50QD86_9GAMM|nr:IucA/IucC family C-terminal-domain containing protein [Oceanimonas pelagia]WMC11934.1 IucA/IucC family protein [Oceanimonas pelagia]